MAPPEDLLAGGGGDDDLVEELTRWLAGQRADAAAAARARERWLRQQAAEETVFAGVLLDLAERGRGVVVHGAGQRRHRGTVRAVAEDFLAFHTVEGVDVLLRYEGIAALRPQGGGDALVGDRPHALDMTMAEAVAALVADRPRVLVVTLDGSALSGEVRVAGRDVLVLRLDGDAASVAYVPLASVAELSLVEGFSP